MQRCVPRKIWIINPILVKVSVDNIITFLHRLSDKLNTTTRPTYITTVITKIKIFFDNIKMKLQKNYDIQYYLYWFILYSLTVVSFFLLLFIPLRLHPFLPFLIQCEPFGQVSSFYHRQIKKMTNSKMIKKTIACWRTVAGNPCDKKNWNFCYLILDNRVTAITWSLLIIWSLSTTIKLPPIQCN